MNIFHKVLELWPGHESGTYGRTDGRTDKHTGRTGVTLNALLPEVIKPFPCLAEHEILNAYKFKNIKKFSFYSCSNKPRMLFFLLINVKMPTVVGILTFMSTKTFILS